MKLALIVLLAICLAQLTFILSSIFGAKFKEAGEGTWESKLIEGDLIMFGVEGSNTPIRVMMNNGEVSVSVYNFLYTGDVSPGNSIQVVFGNDSHYVLSQTRKKEGTMIVVDSNCDGIPEKKLIKDSLNSPTDCFEYIETTWEQCQ